MAGYTSDLAGLVFDFLDSAGDGTGEKNAIGDYSTTPARFSRAYNRDWGISAVNVFIEDTNGFDAVKYGNIQGSPLTNGVSCTVRDPGGTVVKDLTGGFPVKRNAEWSSIGATVQLYTWGSGNEFLDVNGRLVRPRARDGKMVPLPVPAGYSFGFDLNDDFTGLITHRFKVFGWFNGD